MDDRKAHYNKKGLYSGYDKNNKEREALDYYSTPIEEVTNILEILNINFDNCRILEPSAGGGHMLSAIYDYLDKHSNYEYILPYATDIQERKKCREDLNIEFGKEYDFLSDNYPYVEDIDYIIMNPPYSVIEPFVMKSLGIANKGVIMLGRLQFLEGQGRYENILKTNPPTDTYIYVDRVACFKNGDVTQKMASAQAYAWFVWDFLKEKNTKPEIHFIRRYDKKEEM